MTSSSSPAWCVSLVLSLPDRDADVSSHTAVFAVTSMSHPSVSLYISLRFLAIPSCCPPFKLSQKCSLAPNSRRGILLSVLYTVASSFSVVTIIYVTVTPCALFHVLALIQHRCVKCFCWLSHCAVYYGRTRTQNRAGSWTQEASIRCEFNREVWGTSMASR